MVRPRVTRRRELWLARLSPKFTPRGPLSPPLANAHDGDDLHRVRLSHFGKSVIEPLHYARTLMMIRRALGQLNPRDPIDLLAQSGH